MAFHAYDKAIDLCSLSLEVTFRNLLESIHCCISLVFDYLLQFSGVDCKHFSRMYFPQKMPLPQKSAIFVREVSFQFILVLFTKGMFGKSCNVQDPFLNILNIFTLLKKENSFKQGKIQNFAYFFFLFLNLIWNEIYNMDLGFVVLFLLKERGLSSI